MWMLFVARYGMNGLEASSTWDVYGRVGGRVASVDEDCVIFTGSQSEDHEFQYFK